MNIRVRREDDSHETSALEDPAVTQTGNRKGPPVDTFVAELLQLTEVSDNNRNPRDMKRRL